MDFGKMRLQEGFIMDKMKTRIGVLGITRGAGASFVAEGLDYYLNVKYAPRTFVSRPDKYVVEDSPSRPEDMDLLVCVLDPLPSRLEEGAARFAAVRALKVPEIWMINRDNKGVNHKALEAYLDMVPEYSQEAFPYETVCRAAYNCEKLSEVRGLEGIKKLSDAIKKEY